MVVPLICYAFLHPEQDLVIALVTQSPRLFEYYVPLVADCEWNEATLLSSVLFPLCHYLANIVVFFTTGDMESKCSLLYFFSTVAQF